MVTRGAFVARADRRQCRTMWTRQLSVEPGRPLGRPPGRPLGRALRAAIGYFAVVFAAGFVLGTLRVVVLVPRWGETAAVITELPLMLAVSWLVCRSFVARFDVAPAVGPRLVMGGLAFGLLMTVELALGAFAFARPLASQLEAFGTHPAAALGLAGQVVFGLMPLAQLHRLPPQ